MKVYISGKEHSNCSHKELRYAANWFAHTLMSTRLCKSIKVFIKLEKAQKNYYGDMFWLDDNVNPRRFEIELNLLQSRKSLLQTLAHEMVHVKQYARGELKSLFNRKENRWNGQYIVEKSENYYDLPWEIEAFGREVGLYNRYRKHIKTSNIDFKNMVFQEEKAQIPNIALGELVE